MIQLLKIKSEHLPHVIKPNKTANKIILVALTPVVQYWYEICNKVLITTYNADLTDSMLDCCSIVTIWVHKENVGVVSVIKICSQDH